MKGGEKMEMNGLGAINTLVSSVGNAGSSGKSGSSFGSLIAGLMGSGISASQVNLEKKNSNQLSNEGLAQLLQFLQTGDIFELENGTELLGESAALSNSEIIKVIEEELNVTSPELMKILSKLYSDLTTKIDGKKVNLEGLNDESKDAAQLDNILALIQSIISLRMQEMKIEPTNDLEQGMRAIKLFELLSTNPESLDNVLKLKEFMQNVIEKLELILNSGNLADKSDFAKKTFQALANELAGKNLSDSEKSGSNSVQALLKTETVNHQGFIHFQQMSKPEQLTLLSPSGKPVSAEQLIEQFESILSKSQLIKAGETQRLFIKLNPEHLGSLRVELIQKDSSIIARIMTSTANAKDMMESQLHGLKQAFHSQNIQVERIEISQAFTQADRGFNRDQQQGQERQQQEKNQEQPTGDFNHSFEEALLNTEA